MIPTARDFRLARFLGAQAILMVKSYRTYCSLAKARRDAEALQRYMRPGQVKIWEVRCHEH